MDVFRPKHQNIVTPPAPPLGDLIAQIEQGYPFESFVELADRLSVSHSLLADVLNISSSTLQRRRGSNFSVAESGRIYQLRKLVILAEKTVGDKEDARRWLTMPNSNLGAAPLQLTHTAPGIEAVMRYLEQISDGVYL